MNKETMGTVISVARQWWLKINTKAARTHALNGAAFPHVIKVKYTVNDRDYTKRKWLAAGNAVPSVGSTATVVYCENRPTKAKVL